VLLKSVRKILHYVRVTIFQRGPWQATLRLYHPEAVLLEFRTYSSSLLSPQSISNYRRPSDKINSASRVWINITLTIFPLHHSIYLFLFYRSDPLFFFLPSFFLLYLFTVTFLVLQLLLYCLTVSFSFFTFLFFAFDSFFLYSFIFWRWIPSLISFLIFYLLTFTFLF